MHELKIQWCGNRSDDLPVTGACGLQNFFFTISIVIRYILLSSLTPKGPLLFVYHWYNSSATKNPEGGTSALNRGGLIDKLVAAKPALANCLSNALINQTEE